MAFSNSEPRFASKQTRVQIAIAKYHGIGTEDPEGWTQKEIADHLNVARSTVQEYLDDPLAQEVANTQDQVAEQTRLKIIHDLSARLDRLNELEEQMNEIVRPEVTAYEPVQTKGTVTDVSVADHLDLELDESTAPEVDVTVPVPAKVEEMPNLSKLRAIWSAKEQVIEQLEDLLGLEEPDQHEFTGSVEHTKVWKLGDEDDDLPEQSVSEIGSKNEDD